MSRQSRTITQPVGVPQLVSRIIVPGRYRRAAGTFASAGPNRKPPASRSRIAPNTLGPSILGRHIHSTLPLGATSAVTSQSERNAYSAIGGYDETVVQSVFSLLPSMSSPFTQGPLSEV